MTVITFLVRNCGSLRATTSVHWSISNASVSFILDVLLDTIAMPEVILAWSFVLSELCTDLQPVLRYA